MDYKKILKENKQEYEAWFDGGQSIGTFDDLDEATEFLKDATLSALKEDPSLDPADIVSNVYYSYNGTRLSELEPGDEGYDETYADDDEVESFTGEDFVGEKDSEDGPGNYDEFPTSKAFYVINPFLGNDKFDAHSFEEAVEVAKELAKKWKGGVGVFERRGDCEFLRAGVKKNGDVVKMF